MRLVRIFAGLILMGGLIAACWGGFIWWVYYKDQGARGAPKDPAYWAGLDVRVTALRDGLYMLQGDGGNITVLTGPDGLLIVDTDEVWAHNRIRDALAQLQDGPVTHVINTHSHGDHRGGNAAFRAGGADVIAMAATRDNIETDGYAAATPEDLPNVIVEGGHRLTFNGQTITFHHAPLAHTNGDLVIRFQPANVVAAGDVFITDGLPFLSRGAGATLDGHLEGQTMLRGLMDADTILIPGHGEISDRAELINIQTRLRAIRSYMGWLKDMGVSPRFLPLTHPVYAWPAARRKGNGWEKTWARLAYDSLP